MPDKKNPVNVQIGQRIKQARQMAGFNTAAQLLETLTDWGAGRLGNYEAGISQPSPEDILLISELTGSSPCWIMFGLGPIRASGRDVQAIRHQNLGALVDQQKQIRGGLTKMLKAINFSKHKLYEHLENPFLQISDRAARKLEKHCKKTVNWMDEQHVESDPVCASFPEDMRQLMEIYSNLEHDKRHQLLSIAEILAK